jgi:hypothetical protein
VPISGAYKIKGVGDVLAGRVEQGIVKPGDEVIFLPTHTTANPCVGKVFTVEMHHKRVDKAGPGDNVGMNIKVRRGQRPQGGGGCHDGRGRRGSNGGAVAHSLVNRPGCCCLLARKPCCAHVVAVPSFTRAHIAMRMYLPLHWTPASPGPGQGQHAPHR